MRAAVKNACESLTNFLLNSVILKNTSKDRQFKWVIRKDAENATRDGIRVGLVTLSFRSLNSFRRPFVRKPRGFSHPAMSAAVVDYRTH